MCFRVWSQGHAISHSSSPSRAPSPTKRKDRSDEKSKDRSKDKGATKESSEKDRGRDKTRKRRSASSGSSSTRWDPSGGALRATLLFLPQSLPAAVVLIIYVENGEIVNKGLNCSRLVWGLPWVHMEDGVKE